MQPLGAGGQFIAEFMHGFMEEVGWQHDPDLCVRLRECSGGICFGQVSAEVFQADGAIPKPRPRFEEVDANPPSPALRTAL